MQKSTVHLVNELTRLLLQFSPMVSQFERKQPQALVSLQDWIAQAEQLLSSYGIVASAELAGLRSKLMAPVHRDEHRGQLRRQQLREAVDMLYPLQQCVQQALTPSMDSLTVEILSNRRGRISVNLSFTPVKNLLFVP